MVRLAICVLLTGLWSAFACAEIKAGKDKDLAEVTRLDRDVGYNRHRSHGTVEEAKGDEEEETGESRKRLRVAGSDQGDQEGGEEGSSRRSSALILRELRQLRETVNGLKTQSNLMYKQLKSLHKSCPAGSAASVFDSTLSSSSQSPSSSSSSASTLPPVVSPRPDENGAMNNAIQSDALLLNPDPKSNPCPPFFTYFPDYNGCFRLSAERVTWRTARERCLAMNSDLATVESSRKQRVLIENAKTSPDTRHCDFWIGLSRRGSALADWRWAMDDDAPVFTNWNYNEPNNGKGNEHCAQMLWIFHWKWNDAPCNYGNACYICQAKPYA